MKPTFLIAIVAVAMIGVMVPNADAVNLVINKYFPQVAEEPERYTDSNVKLSGQIETIQIYEKRVSHIFKVGGIDNSNRDSFVFYTDKSDKSFSEDDCLVIEGVIRGTTSLSTDKFLTSWEVPYMLLDDYAEIDCLEALYPTISESTVSQTQYMGGATVTIEKVQWSDHHTRILLTVDNTSQNNEIQMYQSNSVLIQDRTQFGSEGVCCSIDYLDSSIPYGSISKGWWVFESTDPESFEIRIALRENTGNYFTSDAYDMIFNIDSIHAFFAPTFVPTITQESILEKIYTNSKKSLGMASFVDTSKDPQSYVDRYNNEPTYKEWFDENYSQYDSIYQAVGLDESTVTVEPTVESTVESTTTAEFIEEPVDELKVTCGTGTEDVDGICQVIQTEEKSSGGGCLIATATYGSEMAPQVQQLRELRDNQLLQTESGTAFMGTFNDVYYSFSPVIADYERENPLFKEAVNLAITPMISTLSLMENAESESEVLGIGLSVIVLNIGMYLAVPAIVIVGIRKNSKLNPT